MVSLAELESKAISIGLGGGYWTRGECTDTDFGIGVYFGLLFPYHNHRFREYHRVGYSLEKCLWYSLLLHFPPSLMSQSFRVGSAECKIFDAYIFKLATSDTSPPPPSMIFGSESLYPVKTLLTMCLK